jgi:hypothetical protein
LSFCGASERVSRGLFDPDEVPPKTLSSSQTGSDHIFNDLPRRSHSSLGLKKFRPPESGFTRFHARVSLFR